MSNISQDKNIKKSGKNNKTSRGSLSRKLNLILVLFLFIVLAALTTYNGISNYNKDIESSINIVSKDGEVLALRLSTTFDETYGTLNNLKNLVETELKKEASKRNREVVFEGLKTSIISNKKLDGVGVYMEPNAFDGKDKDFIDEGRHSNQKGRLACYGYMDGDKTVVRASSDVEDASANAYYTVPLAKGINLLTEPSIQDVDGKKVAMLSYNIPIKDASGNVVGVVLADLSLDKLQEQMLNFRKNYESSYYALISDAGNIAGHSLKPEKIGENELEGHPAFKEKYEEAYKNGTSNKVEVSTSTGKETEYIFSVLEVSGTEQRWVVESATPRNDFISDTKKNLVINIISAIIVLVVMGVLIKIFVDKMVARPLKSIESAMEKIANYNLDTTEERKALSGYIENNDEIGRITRAIRRMVGNLKNIIENISGHASSTAATAQELTATAQSTNEMAREVSTAVLNIAEGATGQAHDTTEAAGNIEENTNSLNEMIKVLEELKLATQDIENKKDEGKEALNKLTGLTDMSKEEAGHVNQIILETNESAEAISKASEMIQSIADQTNLLALNAAIEAARAGEAGKGFAVVADEIRKLAEDSTRFTAEIRQVIETLKEKAQSAVDRMEQVGKIVFEQNEQTGITREKFNEIEEAVLTSKVVVDRISQNSKSIEEKNSEIISVIQNLSAIAEENAATTEEAGASVESQTNSINDISNASANLADIASKLQAEISEFRF